MPSVINWYVENRDVTMDVLLFRIITIKILFQLTGFHLMASGSLLGFSWGREIHCMINNRLENEFWFLGIVVLVFWSKEPQLKKHNQVLYWLKYATDYISSFKPAKKLAWWPWKIALGPKSVVRANVIVQDYCRLSAQSFCWIILGKMLVWEINIL